MLSQLLCGLCEYEISIRIYYLLIDMSIFVLQCDFLQIKLGILTSNRIHTIHHISIIEDQVFK